MSGVPPQNQGQQNVLTVAQGLAAQQAERQRKEEERRRRGGIAGELPPNPVAAVSSRPIRWWRVLLWMAIVVVAVFVLLFLVFVGNQLGLLSLPADIQVAPPARHLS